MDNESPPLPADAQPTAEPASQRKLRRVIIRVAAVVEIRNHTELLIRPKLESQRSVFNPSGRTADTVGIQFSLSSGGVNKSSIDARDTGCQQWDLRCCKDGNAGRFGGIARRATWQAVGSSIVRLEP